jgi:hypothetical protein
MTGPIHYVARAPVSIEAPAGVSDENWYHVQAGGSGESAGTVFRVGEPLPDLLNATGRRELLLHLWSLLRLERGWDSYGAREVSPRAVERALAFLSLLPPGMRPAVVPASQGGIQLEWHDGQADIEIECLPSGNARLSAEDETTGETVERWVVPGHPAVDSWLSRLRRP